MINERMKDGTVFKWFTSDNKLTTDTELPDVIKDYMVSIPLIDVIVPGLSKEDTYKAMVVKIPLSSIHAGMLYFRYYVEATFPYDGGDSDNPDSVYFMSDHQDLYLDDRYGKGVEDGLIKYSKQLYDNITKTEECLFIDGLANKYTKYFDSKSMYCEVDIFNGGEAVCCDNMGRPPLDFAIYCNTLWIHPNEYGDLNNTHLSKMLSLIDDIIGDDYTYDKAVLHCSTDTYSEGGVLLQETVDKDVVGFINDVLIPELKVPVTVID